MSHVWHYYSQNHAQIYSWLLTTIWLAVIPLAIGLVISLPLGWAASRFRWSYPPVVTLGGLIYTLPSIVIFLALPGIIGTQILDPLNVAIALTLYSVALLVRVVADGLNAVDTSAMDAAAAMGYTEWQRLRAVQMPLAIPVIGAGLRVAAVSNVSLIAVASTLGVSQLGSLFTVGNTTGDTAPIWLGLIMFILLALILDAVILSAIRVGTPWRRAVGR